MHDQHGDITLHMQGASATETLPPQHLFQLWNEAVHHTNNRAVRLNSRKFIFIDNYSRNLRNSTFEKLKREKRARRFQLTTGRDWCTMAGVVDDGWTVVVGQPASEIREEKQIEEWENSHGGWSGFGKHPQNWIGHHKLHLSSEKELGSGSYGLVQRVTYAAVTMARKQ